MREFEIVLGVFVSLASFLVTVLPLALWLNYLITKANDAMSVFSTVIVGFFITWIVLLYAPTTLGLANHHMNVAFLGKAKADELEAQDSKPKPYRINTRTEVVRYKLVDMNPPKHFYVKLELNGVVSEHYVSKHCNNYRDNRIGDSYNIPVQFYRMSDGTKEQSELKNLYNVFCE